MKLCKACKVLPTDLLESVRDSVNNLLEIRSQEIALESVENQKPPTNTASHPLALCKKMTVVKCQEFDPASGNCKKCEIRPTDGE